MDSLSRVEKKERLVRIRGVVLFEESPALLQPADALQGGGRAPGAGHRLDRLHPRAVPRPAAAGPGAQGDLSRLLVSVVHLCC